MFLPPSIISISVIVSELIIEITGETNASGLSVGSDEYSKPGFKILISSTLFICC